MLGVFSDLVGEGRELLTSRDFKGDVWEDIVWGWDLDMIALRRWACSGGCSFE